MKLSKTVLLVTLILILMVTGLFVSTFSPKKEHSNAGTSNFYPAYGGIYIFAKYEF